MVRAAEAGVAAQAIRMEQKLEDEILVTAVKKLAADRGDKAKQAEDMRELREMVRRDKRAVEVLTSVLGSSSGVSMSTFVIRSSLNSYPSCVLSRKFLTTDSRRLLHTFFYTSNCTMALGSIQPLTEMSTRNLPGGKGRPARKADNLTAICEPTL
jgi:hypothetical protein